MEPIEAITRLFAERGADAYIGEPVSQLEHALQTAHLAVRNSATDALVVAALLHDIGHLVHGWSEEAADQGIDTRHEELGASWLSQHLPPLVTDPICLHVAAKRYLCATSPAYAQQLSSASQVSLALQGGPMTPAEMAAFESLPYSNDSGMLRLWDEQAKAPGKPVPPFSEYHARLERVFATLRVRC